MEYHTTKYQETIKFYEDKLRLKKVESWNETPRGSKFEVNTGIIEVLEHTENGNVEKISGIIVTWDVEEIEMEYQRIKTTDVDIVQDLEIQPWGSKTFRIRELNGLIIEISEEIE